MSEEKVGGWGVGTYVEKILRKGKSLLKGFSLIGLVGWSDGWMDGWVRVFVWTCNTRTIDIDLHVYLYIHTFREGEKQRFQ